MFYIWIERCCDEALCIQNAVIEWEDAKYYNPVWKWNQNHKWERKFRHLLLIRRPPSPPALYTVDICWAQIPSLPTEPAVQPIGLCKPHQLNSASEREKRQKIQIITLCCLSRKHLQRSYSRGHLHVHKMRIIFLGVLFAKHRSSHNETLKDEMFDRNNGEKGDMTGNSSDLDLRLSIHLWIFRSPGAMQFLPGWKLIWPKPKNLLV